MNKNNIAKNILINGIVQGVGFRPFIYQLAFKYDLKGKIANTSEGVSIHLEGREYAIGEFINDLKSNPPSLSQITGIQSFPDEIKGCQDFSISESMTGKAMSTLISPDVSV
ncbi:MAG: acylphosphatase, partial [Desulfobacteraceae bacterium]